jgi:hypothetical protein
LLKPRLPDSMGSDGGLHLMGECFIHAVFPCGVPSCDSSLW